MPTSHITTLNRRQVKRKTNQEFGGVSREIVSSFFQRNRGGEKYVTGKEVGKG